MRVCQTLFVLFLVALPFQARASLESDLGLWQAQTEAARPSPAVVAQLIQRHAEWPGLAAMVAKIESNRDFLSAPPSDVAVLFTQRTPRSAAGIKAYMDALGNTPQAGNVVRNLWRTEPLDRVAQTQILSAHANRLTLEDHDARLDMLLDNDRVAQAEDVAMLLGSEAQAYVATRAAIIRGTATTPDVLPTAFRNRPQIIADFAKRYAKNDQEDASLAMLRRLGTLDQGLAAELWKPRHIIARNMLEHNRPRDAFALLTTHGLTQSAGSDYAAAEFMAGFVALKYMNDPQAALAYFARMHQNVTGAISKARAAYWAGRAAEQAGDKPQAGRWYQEAASWPTTFFGQKALEKTGGNLASALQSMRASQATANLSQADSRVQAAQIFYNNGKPAYGRQFMIAAMKDARNQADYIVLARIAQKNADRSALVKIAREAGKNGFSPDLSGFPRLNAHEIEQASAGGMRGNIPLVHAIIRQESEFDADAQSHAGARGLMQLMPATASQTARKGGMRHDVAWLTARPDHNVRLGSSYLASMLNQYDGSKVLAIAAYNAGPGRVRQWIGRFGDPRTAAISAEDWIELIPVYETRNYIQRVLEGEAVYAATL